MLAYDRKKGGQIVPDYFTVEQINSKGTPVPPEYRANAAELVKNMNTIQNELYKISPTYKMVITSSYRTPSHNASAGGVENSRHLTAQAVDFKVENFPASAAQDLIKNLIDRGVIKAGGVGQGANFTHYDIRGYKTAWTYDNGSGSGTSSTSWRSSNTPQPVATRETIFLNDIDLSEEHKNHVARSNLPGNVGFSFGEPHHPDRNWTTRQRWFKPKKNLLIMFPSLLEHFVIPFHTDVERVSVSGNIYILNKEKLQLNDKGDPRDRQHEFYF